MLKKLNWATVASVAAVTAIIVSIAGIYFQLRQAHLQHSVDLVLKIDDKFDEERFIKKRKAAAKALLNKTYDDADDVLNFFESMGMLVRRGAIDEEMTWNTFYYWIHRYRLAAKVYMEQEQKKSLETWDDFIELDKRMVALEKRKTGGTSTDIEISVEKIKDFLQNEAALKTK
jgi:hypothetical protein